MKKRILVSGSIIKYPWGGLRQYLLAWLVGFKELGFEAYYLEDVEWEYSCFDLTRNMMTSDPSPGIKSLKKELTPYNLENNWCFVDHNHQVFGKNKSELKELLKTADTFFDL